MATFTASAADSTNPALYRISGCTTRVSKYTHPIALSAGDVIQMVRVPQGATITNLGFGVSASAGAITVNVGDGNDTSAYAASIVLSATQILTVSTFRGTGRSYSAEDTIDIVITALSAVPGTVDLYLRVDYTNSNGG
jgi:hypothetical protein